MALLPDLKDLFIPRLSKETEDLIVKVDLLGPCLLLLLVRDSEPTLLLALFDLDLLRLFYLLLDLAKYLP